MRGARAQLPLAAREWSAPTAARRDGFWRDPAPRDGFWRDPTSVPLLPPSGSSEYSDDPIIWSSPEALTVVGGRAAAGGASLA